jgi:exonuclease V gamma subunit
VPAAAALADALRLERAQGALGPGAVGAQQLEALRGAAAQIAEHAADLGAVAARALRFDGGLPDGTRLHGVLEGLGPAGMLHQQFGRAKIRNLLGLWVQHLALCWAPGEGRPPDVPARSVLIGRPPSDPRRWNLRGRSAGAPAHHCACFEAVADPAGELAELVALLRAGWTAPLALLPETSYAYAAARRRGADAAEAMGNAARTWSTPQAIDRRDAHLVRVFGASLPPFADVVTAGPPFDALAERVLGSMLSHLREQAG